MIPLYQTNHYWIRYTYLGASRLNFSPQEFPGLLMANFIERLLDEAFVHCPKPRRLNQVEALDPVVLHLHWRFCGMGANIGELHSCPRQFPMHPYCFIPIMFILAKLMRKPVKLLGKVVVNFGNTYVWHPVREILPSMNSHSARLIAEFTNGVPINGCPFHRWK